MFIDENKSDCEKGLIVVFTAQLVRWRTADLRAEGYNPCRYPPFCRHEISIQHHAAFSKVLLATLSCFMFFGVFGACKMLILSYILNA